MHRTRIRVIARVSDVALDQARRVRDSKAANQTQ
jgi:hypothetical protein